MLLVLVAHIVAAMSAPVLVTWLGRRAFWVLAAAPASAVVYALAHTGDVLGGATPVQVVEWVPALGLQLAFRLDALAWLMLLAVGGIGTLVLLYCSAYFARSAHGLRRFAAVLTAFAGAMVGLVTADDLLLLFVFWELTTVFSYLLIGHYTDRKPSRRAAMQAIVVTTAGGLAMLVGLVILGVDGTWRLSDLVADPPHGPAVTVAVVCLLAGAASKSALVPLHFWLPAAMAAPTPVSAYLHAAAMVKAGVYLVARFAPAYADVPVWQVMVLVLGAGTMLLGGYRALRQHDLKLLLAFGTVSQLGLLVLLLGFGTQAAALAGLALLGAHAMCKAALFLVVGVVDAATGTRDLRSLSGLARALPGTAVAAVLATASMIGLPPTAGFVAKEAALAALLPDADHAPPAGLLAAGGGAAAWVLLTAVVLGSALTVAYGLRFVWGAFGTRRATVPVADPSAVGRQPLLLTGPPLVLALLGVAAAVAAPAGEAVLGRHAETYAGAPGHLSLAWGGLTPALGLTLAALALGVALFRWRDAVERAQDRLRVPAADGAYRRTMRRLDELAADVTGFTQRGSLPVYLGVILVVLAVGPGLAVAWGLVTGPLPVDLVPWDRPAQAAVVAVVGVAAVLAARSRRRLKAVILVGVVGYGNAVLFLLHGAPDLALTQVLCETVTLVVMVLVLRRLPPYFSDRPLAADRWVRLAVGVLTGVVMMVFAVVAPAARIHIPVAADFPEEAVSFGGGHDIVNVTLVDIRAWDTVGEISVLLVAATGVASLVFLRVRSGEVLRMPRARDGVLDGARTPGPLAAGRTLAPRRRSVLLEVATRIVFHAMIVFAVFLLLVGHDRPGGGFPAGLVVGIALAVRYLAGGRYELGEAAPVHPGLLLGTGLFLSAGVGLAALLFGGEVLQSWILDWEVPVLGHVHLVTSLFFDVGVMLVVVGLALDILRTLGAELDRQAEEDGDTMTPGRTVGMAGATGETRLGVIAVTGASDGAPAQVPAGREGRP